MLKTYDGKLARAVQHYIDTHPRRDVIDALTNRLGSENMYFFGSMVKAPLLALAHNRPLAVNDIDIMINGVSKDDVRTLLADMGTFSKTSMGGLRLTLPDAYQVDPHPLAHMCAHDPTNVSIQTALDGMNLTINALTYSPRERLIHSTEGVEAIEHACLDIHNADTTPAPVLMAQVIVHSEYMRFRIGNRARTHIQTHYKPDYHPVIQKYLAHRKIPERFEHVKKRLEQIHAGEE